MELGLAIVIFLISAIILMALFCIVTKYFNYRLQKALLQQNQEYSLVEGLEGERQDINEGEYEDFVHKRIQDRKKKELEKDKNYQAMLQMTEVVEPLKEAGDNIYEMSSKLKQRLGLKYFAQLTRRSLSSAKQFKPERLDIARDFELIRNNTLNSDTYRGNTLNTYKYSIQQQKNNKKSYQQNQTQIHKEAENRAIGTYRYINKLISYTENGIVILACKVSQIWKNQHDEIFETKKIQKTSITDGQLEFDDTLEAYGFEKGTYGAFKFITSVDVSNLKQCQVYKMFSLKKSDEKEDISLPEFQTLSWDLERQRKKGTK